MRGVRDEGGLDIGVREKPRDCVLSHSCGVSAQLPRRRCGRDKRGEAAGGQRRVGLRTAAAADMGAGVFSSCYTTPSCLLWLCVVWLWRGPGKPP